MKRYSYHTARKERQHARKQLKSDKRAMDALVKLHGCATESFSRGCGWNEGRIMHWTSCYTDCGTEWDCRPATDELRAIELFDYECECIDGKTGEYLPDDQCPPCPPSALRKAPAGWRWRGGRLVPVDKHGAMVRVKDGKGRYAK